MRHSFVIVAACVAALASTAVQAHDGHDDPGPVGAFDMESGNDIFKATLLGSNEIAGGDVDGFGTALIAIDHHTNTVNYEITFSGLSSVTAAHIHNAPAGVNGPIKVLFGVPAGSSGSGSFSGSVVDPDAEFITALTAGNFYVNIHSSEFPGGALRGQLVPVPEPETYALMLGGLGIVAWTVRRRRTTDAAA